MKDFINLLNHYPKLTKPKVTLIDLGVAPRVFSNWKEKGIIDYDHKFTDEEVSNNVQRKKIELNVFEALWILIVQELRQFNIGLSTIKALKNFLFSLPDYNSITDITKDELDQIINATFDKAAGSFIKSLNFQLKDLVGHFINSNHEQQVYFNNISSLVNAILILGDAPSIQIYKTPADKELSFRIYNPTVEKAFYKQLNKDFRDDFIMESTRNSIINIPIKPLFEQFFENKTLLRHAKVYDLYTSAELQILQHIKDKDFQKITIYKSDADTITLEKSSSKQISGHNAKKLRSLLGLKQYKRVEVIFRDDKTLVIKNTQRIKIKTNE